MRENTELLYYPEVADIYAVNLEVFVTKLSDPRIVGELQKHHIIINLSLNL